jgi:hypothetical protein
MAEREPSISVESGNEDTRFTRAINGAKEVFDMVQLLKESEKTEIKDSDGRFYLVENVMANLNNLEDLIKGVSEVEINSLNIHRQILDYLNLIPQNYSLRLHALRLLTHINPAMKEFIF